MKLDKKKLFSALAILLLLAVAFCVFQVIDKNTPAEDKNSSLQVLTPTPEQNTPTVFPDSSVTPDPTLTQAATPTPTSTASKEATPTDSASKAATPTVTPSKTATPKPTNTVTLKPTKKATPTPKPAIDKDGWYYSKNEVALYIHTYGCLPSNYITKKEAEALGWTGGSVQKYKEGAAIGGSVFGNYEGLLPQKKGRTYYECDIDTNNKSSRGAKRIIYSNDGLIFYTDDHYESFTQLY